MPVINNADAVFIGGTACDRLKVGTANLWNRPVQASLVSTTGSQTPINVGGIDYILVTLATGQTVTTTFGSLELFIVGGGGGGAYDTTATGGGGGLIVTGTLAVSAGTYTATVGAAGAVYTGGTRYQPGYPGGTSSINMEGGVSAGGGGGGQVFGPGGAGGSTYTIPAGSGLVATVGGDGGAFIGQGVQPNPAPAGGLITDFDGVSQGWSGGGGAGGWDSAGGLGVNGGGNGGPHSGTGGTGVRGGGGGGGGGTRGRGGPGSAGAVKVRFKV